MFCHPKHGIQCTTNSNIQVSCSHTNPLALKTDCPSNIFWDIFRKWAEQHPCKNDNANTTGYKILSQPCTSDVVYTFTSQINFTPTDELLSFYKEKGEERITRFPANPEKNWGPKSRAPMKKQRVRSVISNVTLG